MAELTLHTYRDPEIFNFNIVNADNRKIEEAVNGTIPWSLASNQNLLINSYFADPINQRGQTEYTNAGYTIDRWYLQDTTFAKLLLTNEGISLSIQNNDGIVQNIEKEYLRSGEVYTSSILTADGKLLFCTFTLTDTITKYRYNNSNFWCAAGLGGSNAFWKFWSVITYENPSSITTTIVAAKLELGDHPTLAHQDANGNWVLNDPPPDKALELAKCQRYYICFDEGIYPSGYITNSALEYYANLSLPVPLRTYPSLVGTPAFTVRLPAGGYSSRFPVNTATADSYRLGGYAANCISLVGIINAAVDPNNIPISLKVMPFALDAELY